MSHNQKVAVFFTVMLGAAILLWGFKGVTQLLPGPTAK